MLKKTFIGSITIALILGINLTGYARDYLVTYGYKTPHKGEFEIELWTDYDIKDKDNSDLNIFKHQTEAEYGITDHWMVGFYVMFKQKRNEGLEYDGLKIETRYRFFEAGEKFIDPALYFEYKNLDGPGDKNSDILEAKLILSKDIGDFNVTTNLKYFEKEINSSKDIEFGYALGMSYPFFDKAKLGLEFKGDLGEVSNNQKHYIIPGVYMDLWHDVELALGIGFGLTSESDDVLLKSILEIEF